MQQLIKDRRLLLLFFSNLFSNIGINVTAIGIPWYFLQNAGDEGQLLGVTMIIGTVIVIENRIGFIVLTAPTIHGDVRCFYSNK